MILCEKLIEIIQFLIILIMQRKIVVPTVKRAAKTNSLCLFPFVFGYGAIVEREFFAFLNIPDSEQTNIVLVSGNHGDGDAVGVARMRQPRGIIAF